MNSKLHPIQRPETFIQNTLIKEMEKHPYWTVSDTKKRPVHAKKLLESETITNATFDDGSPMVTLDQLDANQNLQAVNRAYRLRARDNHIICIDVEPEAPNSMIEQALNFPAHYTEHSTNGGVHLLIKVPKESITEDIKYMMEELNVFKEPVEKGLDREAYYEVLFNDHYITLTKRMDIEKPEADFINDLNAKQSLDSFLTNIVELDKERKVKRERIKQFRIELFDKSIDPEIKDIIHQFINAKSFNSPREQASLKTPNEFGGDMSRYEMSVTSGLASHVIRLRNLRLKTRILRKNMLKLSDQDIVYAIYMLAKDVIPYRDKHEQTREELPWLMYIAKNAYEYISSQK